MRNPVGAKIFGESLRAHRKAKKWSQLRLAVEAEIERTTVNRIELALVTPTLDVLISISRALGVSIPELMKDDAIVESDGDSSHGMNSPHKPPSSSAL